MQNFSNKFIILLALGPTATCLAYFLSNHGYQALDLGHLDIEYEWYLRKAKRKVIVNDKYTNEVDGGRHPGEYKNAKYISEIVKVFKNE